MVTINVSEQSVDGFICLPIRIPRASRAWEKGVSPFHPSEMVAGWSTWEWQFCLPGSTFANFSPAVLGQVLPTALGCCADMSVPHHSCPGLPRFRFLCSSGESSGTKPAQPKASVWDVRNLFPGQECSGFLLHALGIRSGPHIPGWCRL